MKTGYKFFIISQVVGVALKFTPIQLPSVIEEIWGVAIGAALLHAIFIAKSPVKPYKDSNINVRGTSNNYSHQQEQRQTPKPAPRPRTYNCPRCGRTTSSPGYCGSNCATGNGFGTFRM